MARFMITTTNPPIKDGQLVVALKEHKDNSGTVIGTTQVSPIMTSVRESRAKRHARKLRADGYKSVMLFKKSGDNWLPIGFKQSTRLPVPHNGSNEPNCNSPFIDLHPDPKAQKVQSVVVRLNRLARQAANA